jgi:hypothetical protein
MITDPSILFAMPKAISADDKKALKAAGVIVVETPDPLAVRLIRPCAELPVSEMLALACEALKESDHCCRLFGRSVAAAVMAKEKSMKVTA